MSSLSPAKVVLLAAHFTAHADIESLSRLAGRRAAILQKELLLRILLTLLPETVEPSAYTGLLQDLVSCSVSKDHNDGPLDIAPVANLSEEDATRRVKKLHLLQLFSPDLPHDPQDGLLASFLIQRACRIDREAGPMSRLPDLLLPFLKDAPSIRPWVVSSVLPYVRRNFEYYAPADPLYSLIDFQNLEGRTAVTYLLSLTGRLEGSTPFVGRDLRGLIGPWLQDQPRWKGGTSSDDAPAEVSCLGWEQVLEWLISQPFGSTTIAAAAVEQWDGPWDLDLVEGVPDALTGSQRTYLMNSYARAGLASSYLLSEATSESLTQAYRVTRKIRFLLGFETVLTIPEAVSNLPDMSQLDLNSFSNGRTATYMRNDLLQKNNPLTSPTEASTRLLLALIISAFICTRLGMPLTIKSAGDLFFLQDRRDQEAELKRLIRATQNYSRGDNDEYWKRVRDEVLWLHSWGPLNDHDDHHLRDERRGGLFGAIPREIIEGQILKTLLTKSRCALARSIYEDGPGKPLPSEMIQEIIHESALHAFDNASNPNRSRGGLKKCDEIIHAFPKTMGTKHPVTKQLEALLRCTHALSDYRLVLKQGEPFSPVLLRVHSDPISIIDKVLEQNSKAYTRLQEFLEMASNMVHAGLYAPRKTPVQAVDPLASDEMSERLATAEKRIVAMCIEAALREDDFETAYSYVVSRLDSSASDGLTWAAALKAGQYVRSERTLQPTHLGTASGNLEVRHLEQRIECLATALRAAPAPQLQEILKTFRRCEEQLEFTLREEAASELLAWKSPGAVPGAFQEAAPFGDSSVPRSMAATAAAKRTEDAPMSLFDLSRATARLASRNLGKLSSLPLPTSSPSSGTMEGSTETSTGPELQGQFHPRTRKRDQLREAATGTLVSGVGWLIGANPSK